jgi:hypothetical protein
MTIPHVAIVAGCLLAGNNPNTLEVIIVGISTFSPKLPKTKKRWWHYLNLYRPSYTSVYQPVWMWERGRSKRNCIRRVQSQIVDEAPSGEEHQDEAMPVARNKGQSKPQYDCFKLHPMDWVFLILVALALMVTPFILAFLTSYYTPIIGLSCRSFTFVLYFVFQFWLSLVWFWDFGRPKRHPYFEHVSWPALSKKKLTVPSVYCVVVALGFCGSAFTTIVGTFMQILGVYRNCVCDIPMSAWDSGDYSINVSSNSADRIRYAKNFWLPTGIASIVVLVFVCYVGWWYQRHWRSRFVAVIDKILPPSDAKSDTENKEQLVSVENPAEKIKVTESHVDEIMSHPLASE